MKYYLAIDIGASSGRHIIGYKDEDGKIINEEIYRFKNHVQEYQGHLIWDIKYLFQEVKNGIKEALKKYKVIESLSIDTWGVDYVLLNKDEEIYPVYSYRDNRTAKAIQEVHKIIPFERLYEITGCQFQRFTTIYQLYDDFMNKRLDNVTDFLMIPEYLMYKLTGNKKKELTEAITTGLLDCKTKKFSKEIIKKLQLPDIFNVEVSKPGTVVGDLTKSIQKEVGGNIKVVLCATHDTASAVEGIPVDKDTIYISSGTWSLLGIKTLEPITTLKAMEANYSNELGPNYIRFQKNIMGMWIIQNLAEQTQLNFLEMVEHAKKSNYCELFNVNDDRFTSPKDMRQEIINYFKEHKQRLPLNDDDIINCVYHSLANSYKLAIEELENITGRKFEKLCIAGGGAKNVYLNSLVIQYVDKELITYPIEATAIGNLKIQMEV